MSDASAPATQPHASPLKRLSLFALWALLAGVMITPFAYPAVRGAVETFLYRFGISAWSAHVLILVAVLTLSVPSPVVAFQLALLASVLQGYYYMTGTTLWFGQSAGNEWDEQIQFALSLGLAATLFAVLWLLVRVVGKVGLTSDAVSGSGRSGQLGLRELLYVMASLSAVLAFVSLFSLPGIIPVELVLAGTVVYAAKAGPVALGPFWLAAQPSIRMRHWLWLLPLTVACAAVAIHMEFKSNPWVPWRDEVAAFLGTICGTACAVIANAAALHLLGLTWRQGGADAPPENRQLSAEARYGGRQMSSGVS